MKLRIDPTAKAPPSEQLRAQIEGLIERGRLLPGDRLPTVRDLAADLGLATNTVAKAYRELEGAGLAVGRGRHGTFVADALPERPTGGEARLAEAARAFARRARQLGMEDAAAVRQVRRALRDTRMG